MRYTPRQVIAAGELLAENGRDDIVEEYAPFGYSEAEGWELTAIVEFAKSKFGFEPEKVVVPTGSK